MPSVRVWINSKKSSCNLHEMRDWLDQIGFAPTRFDYAMNDLGELISVRVDFSSPEEADIFCTQFDGEAISPLGPTANPPPEPTRSPRHG
jgi:hypothetical protein